MRLNRDKTRWDWKHYLPDPRHISDKWQSISPGSLHNSTTSRHSVSGVTGTSVKCWSLLLRYTVRNIWGQQEGTDKEKHKMEDPGSLCAKLISWVTVIGVLYPYGSVCVIIGPWCASEYRDKCWWRGREWEKIFVSSMGKTKKKSVFLSLMLHHWWILKVMPLKPD